MRLWKRLVLGSLLPIQFSRPEIQTVVVWDFDDEDKREFQYRSLTLQVTFRFFRNPRLQIYYHYQLSITGSIGIEISSRN